MKYIIEKQTQIFVWPPFILMQIEILLCMDLDNFSHSYEANPWYNILIIAVIRPILFLGLHF